MVINAINEYILRPRATSNAARRIEALVPNPANDSIWQIRLRRELIQVMRPALVEIRATLIDDQINTNRNAHRLGRVPIQAPAPVNEENITDLRLRTPGRR